LWLAIVPVPLHAQTKPPAAPPTLKSILLSQLKSTHNAQDWFVPASKAVEGMTFDQANWKGGNANHTVAHLARHIPFWTKQQLATWKGQKPPAFSGKNDETFGGAVDKASWDNQVR